MEFFKLLYYRYQEIPWKERMIICIIRNFSFKKMIYILLKISYTIVFPALSLFYRLGDKDNISNNMGLCTIKYWVLPMETELQRNTIFKLLSFIKASMIVKRGDLVSLLNSV